MKLNPYPAYKDSGVEWLGKIPAHWEAKRLKFVAPVRVNKLDVKPDDAVYVGLEHLESWTGRLLLDKQPEGVDSVVLSFQSGDVLFGKLRPYLAKAARPDFAGVCTSEILALRPDVTCLQSYLMYCLLDAPFIHWLDSLTYGTKMPRVSPEQVGCSLAPVPHLDEQHAIAVFLDRETAKIDALVAKKERLIELLQEKRAALITHAVTKGLDPTVPMKDSGIEWLSRIPSHWEIRRNGNLFRERDERGFPELPLLNVSINTGVTIREFSTERIEQKAEDPATAKRAKAGDIAFNKMRMWQGAVGVAPIDGLVSPDYVVAKPLDGVDSEYFQGLFRIEQYKTEVNRYSHGIVDDRNRLYWEGFKQIKSVVPPYPEQREITQWIDENCSKLDALIAKVREGIEKLKEYRTALISAAVTRRINVRQAVSVPPAAE